MLFNFLRVGDVRMLNYSKKKDHHAGLTDSSAFNGTTITGRLTTTWPKRAFGSYITIRRGTPTSWHRIFGIFVSINAKKTYSTNAFFFNSLEN